MATSALDRIRAGKKPAYRRIPICMDSSHTIALQQLEAKVDQLTAKLGRNNSTRLLSQLEQAEIELEEAKEEALDRSEWFEVRALAPDVYQALIDEHAPSKDQVREARKKNGPRASLEFNPDTFPKALLAACTYVLTKTGEDADGDPVFDDGEQLTPEFVEEMNTGADGDAPQWNTGELDVLTGAAYNINQSSGNINAAGNA
jgi:hypothetical protein